MIKTVLIDDEPHSLETLELLLDAFCPQVQIIGIADSAERGIRLIHKLQPDLVFLDISMPLMNGFELLNRIENRQFELIFTTAYDQYALQAFKVGALHYLLKPIDKQELVKAVERVQGHIKSKREKEENFQNITSIIQQLTANRQPKIAVPSLKGLEMLEVDNIIRCEADSNYTLIHLISNKLLITKTLKELEQMLAPYNFIRIHNSHLINLAHLKTYLKGEGGTVVLSNGDEVSVSRSRKAQLIEKLEGV